MSKDKDSSKDDDDVMVDMYHMRSKWTAILFITFVVAFLIFALALLLYPQSV